jgi:hypothetical protein
VYYSLPFPPVSAILTLDLKAAKGVSDEYDALIELLENFERYIRRLQVFTTIPRALGKILVEIMVELLGVLTLTTRQINEGRFSESALSDTSHLAQHHTEKFAKKLFLGENDVEEVLQRLDRLTEEELRMTATQTLEVVNGLFKDMKTVIDGMENLLDIFVFIVSRMIVLSGGKASMNNIREALGTIKAQTRNYI